ncbi:hypothetical protein [Frankia torreyi]|uniref:hypothetical protein n=1 Tax=Frankia torreyi TaxID=1856 RepID=UPI003BB6B30E
MYTPDPYTPDPGTPDPGTPDPDASDPDASDDPAAAAPGATVSHATVSGATLAGAAAPDRRASDTGVPDPATRDPSTRDGAAPDPATRDGATRDGDLTGRGGALGDGTDDHETLPGRSKQVRIGRQVRFGKGHAPDGGHAPRDNHAPRDSHAPRGSHTANDGDDGGPSSDDHDTLPGRAGAFLGGDTDQTERGRRARRRDRAGRRDRAAEATWIGAADLPGADQPETPPKPAAEDDRAAGAQHTRLSRRRLLVTAVGLGAAAGGGLIAGRLLSSEGSVPGGLPQGQPSTPVGGVTAGPSVQAGSVTKLPENLLTIYGAPGSFGNFDGGQTTVRVTEVPGWGFGPGQAAFNSAVSADGTVFMTTTPFSDDQSKLTGTDMEIEIFEPDIERFTRLVIPSTKGRLSLPRLDPNYRGVGGGDTSDVIVVPGPDGAQRVLFTSLMPYYGWNTAVDGELPSVGQLRRDQPTARWVYDPQVSWTAEQLATTASPSLAAQAFPPLTPLQPRSSRGPASIARLPRSGHLVIAQYLGAGGGGTDNGALLVVDSAGRVLAHWQYPQVRPLGIALVVNPREVVADPTSEPDDERFVLISDVRGLDYSTQPFPIQEFSYSASRGTITPCSTAVRAVQDGSRMESAVFGADGTLYVARTKSDGLHAETVAVYPKLGRERGLVTRAPATGNWPTDTWGIANQPDYLVAGTDQGGLVRSITLDPRTGAVLLAGLDGLVQVVRPAGRGARMTFRTEPPIDVGLNMLRGPSTRYVGVRRGAVDPLRRSLWLPVNQMVLDGLPWPYPPFKLDQWLMRVDLDVLLGDD